MNGNTERPQYNSERRNQRTHKPLSLNGKSGNSRRNPRDQKVRIEVEAGHDAILRKIKEEGRAVRVTIGGTQTEHGAIQIMGKLVDYDRFSLVVEISMDTGELWQHVVFKHSIESFTSLPAGESDRFFKSLAEERKEILQKREAELAAALEPVVLEEAK